MFAAIAALPIVMCSCPDSCVDENEPKGFVAKMKNDYSDKVMVRMFIDSIRNDTSYCCVSKGNHTVNIIGKYYSLNHYSYDIAVYTSIKSEDWEDSMMDSISKYIVDTNPFEEVYAYYKKSYSLDELKKIIENNELNKFERLK